ncbi:MAG: transketolase [Bacteroidetes bacterium B1(2017)]|nr:MAG: transketolase [Bacteroidetes bacterium B1(2017)]
MRKEVSIALLNLADTNPKFVFLTGDLGFMAFEDLQAKMGERFVNMGISEQNMISVAASLAQDGNLPFVYSIAPFVINRPFEQIRNEMGMHNLPVKIVGNGGGYGYGIMGSTHHCLEDIALMRSVQNMQIYLPTYNTDVEEAVAQMALDPKPNYLRLNNSENRPENVGAFDTFRQLSKGSKGCVIGAGPVILNVVALNQKHNLDLSIWAIGKIPIIDLPSQLVADINHNKKVITIEEHFKAGGIGELVSLEILKNTAINKDQLKWESLVANGYPSGNYGDQKWHQEENKLGGQALLNALEQFQNL